MEKHEHEGVPLEAGDFVSGSEHFCIIKLYCIREGCEEHWFEVTTLEDLA
jgi:hypothetical protein